MAGLIKSNYTDKEREAVIATALENYRGFEGCPMVEPKKIVPTNENEQITSTPEDEHKSDQSVDPK